MGIAKPIPLRTSWSGTCSNKIKMRLFQSRIQFKIRIIAISPATMPLSHISLRNRFNCIMPNKFSNQASVAVCCCYCLLLASSRPSRLIVIVVIVCCRHRDCRPGSRLIVVCVVAAVLDVCCCRRCDCRPGSQLIVVGIVATILAVCCCRHRDCRPGSRLIVVAVVGVVMAVSADCCRFRCAFCCGGQARTTTTTATTQ